MKPIANIVFTKNRPLQLDAYLRSLYRFFPSELIQTHIVYKAERFDSQYERLFREFPGSSVIRESDFHTDVMGILNGTDSRYILFGVDDTVFFDSVSFEVIEETFAQHDEDIFGFTLRFSCDSLGDTGDEVEPVTAADESIYRLNWKNGHTAHTRYPFELGCTFYRTDLIRQILRDSMSSSHLAYKLLGPSSALMRVLSPLGRRRSTLKRFGFFFSPNTLESWPCRWCCTHPDALPSFTYFQKLCAVAIQVNMVNTSTANEHYGTAEHTVEALNEKYKQGYVLDIEHVAASKPTEPSAGREFFRLCRDARPEAIATERTGL